MKIILVSVFVLFIGFCVLALQLTKDEYGATFENVDQLLHKFFSPDKLAGGSVALFNPDSVFFTKSFGYADLQSKTRYTNQTPQYLASISKTTIGIGLLKAQELGYLHIDDPINAHLPFTISNPHFPNSTITIQQLATHTSSLDYNESVVESMYVEEKLKDISLRKFMEDYFVHERYGKVMFSNELPGTHWNYSNIGAALAAYIIEYKSGLPFAEFTRHYIFDPIDLENTSWYKRDLGDSIPTKYYRSVSTGTFEEVSDNGVQLYPARDLLMNMNDLIKYAQATFGRSDKLLSPESFETMFTPQLNSQTQGCTADNQGIFWFIDRNQFGLIYQLVGHNGGDHGITTMMLFDPKSKLGYLFIGNTAQNIWNKSRHIHIMRTLMSLGEFIHGHSSHSLSSRWKFKMHNISNRIWGTVLEMKSAFL